MSQQLTILFCSQKLYTAIADDVIGTEGFGLFFKMTPDNDTVLYGAHFLDDILQGRRHTYDLTGIYDGQTAIQWQGQTASKAVLLNPILKEIQAKYEQLVNGNSLKTTKTIPVNLLFSPAYADTLIQEIQTQLNAQGFQVKSTMFLDEIMDKDLIINDFHVFKNKNLIGQHAALWSEKAYAEEIVKQAHVTHDKSEINRQIVRAKRITKKLLDAGQQYTKLKINTTVAPEFNPVSVVFDIEPAKEKRIQDYNKFKALLNDEALYFGFDDITELDAAKKIDLPQLVKQYNQKFASKAGRLSEYEPVEQIDLAALQPGNMIKLQNFDARPGKGASEQELKFLEGKLFEIVNSTRSLAPGDKVELVSPQIAKNIQLDFKVLRAGKNLGLFRTRKVVEIFLLK